jgi:dethiobiotin synthetase
VSGRVVVVSGTGTEIGKTHFAVTLLRALGTLVPRVVGLKPIESGVVDPLATDAAKLRAVSSFHVKPFGYSLRDGVSPHLAARWAGVTLELDPLLAGIAAVRQDADVTVVELPGGLFSPLTDRVLNADLVRQLQPDALLLVVPDRLGALHEVIATRRAAENASLCIDGLVLASPRSPDASTGHNIEEFPHFVDVPVLAELPFAPAEELAGLDAVVRLARRIVAGAVG